MLDRTQIDGDCHEVAKVLATQLEDRLVEAQAGLDDFEWGARGAWMTAEYERTGEMPADHEFYDSALARRIGAMRSVLFDMKRDLYRASLAASWNPRGTPAEIT